jgi:integrase
MTELCQLRWRAVDVHHERLIIEQAKTDAGRRQVDMTLDVVDELNAWRAEQERSTWTGSCSRPRAVSPRTTSAPCLAGSSRRRTSAGRLAGLSRCLRSCRTHCRRTYISLMLEAGAPLHYVMDQVGHEDSKTTLEIYAHVQKRVSRPQVKRAFEELLARTDVGELGVAAEAREKMSDQTAEGAT